VSKATCLVIHSAQLRERMTTHNQLNTAGGGEQQKSFGRLVIRRCEIECIDKTVGVEGEFHKFAFATNELRLSCGALKKNLRAPSASSAC